MEWWCSSHVDFGVESSNEEEASQHSPDDDFPAPSTANTPAPTDNTADTTTAHHLVVAPSTSEDELTVPELQEWLTKHARKRSKGGVRCDSRGY